MVLILFAVVGFVLGYRLGTSRRGFVVMATVAVGGAALQIGHLLTSSDRSWMTMLPLVVSAIVVAFMLIGSLARRTAPGAGNIA